MSTFKIKSNSGDWKYFSELDKQIEDLDYSTKCKELFRNKFVQLFESDILQTFEGDKVLIEEYDLGIFVKVLMEDDFESRNFDKEEGFFMNLDNFLKYNSFYIIGNKFDFKKES